MPVFREGHTFTGGVITESDGTAHALSSIWRTDSAGVASLVWQAGGGAQTVAQQLRDFAGTRMYVHFTTNPANAETIYDFTPGGSASGAMLGEYLVDSPTDIPLVRRVRVQNAGNANPTFLMNQRFGDATSQGGVAYPSQRAFNAWSESGQTFYLIDVTGEDYIAADASGGPQGSGWYRFTAAQLFTNRALPDYYTWSGQAPIANRLSAIRSGTDAVEMILAIVDTSSGHFRPAF